MIVLHEHEIRKQRPPFKFLQNEKVREKFIEEMNKIVAGFDMAVIASVIDKIEYRRKFPHLGNPYHVGLRFCMERTNWFLHEAGASGALTHIVFEERGQKENAALELEFRRVADGMNSTKKRMDNLACLFANKRANSSGLQIADLFARPIGLSVVRPDQQNRAFDLIKLKLNASLNGITLGYGLDVFP